MRLRNALPPISGLLLSVPIMLAALAGCSEPTVQSPATSQGAAPDAVATPSPTEDTTAEKREIWDAYYMEDTKVGYGWTTIQSVEEQGQSLVRIDSEVKMTLSRFGQTVTSHIILASTETPAGDVLRFRSEAKIGGQSLLTEGTRKNDTMLLAIITAGQKAEVQLPWDNKIRGFFAVHQSMRANPLKPGEKRTERSFWPIFNLIAETSFVAADWEEVELLEGKRRLLRVDSSTALPGSQPITTIYWVDETGAPMKASVPAAKQTVYRTTKEEAMRTEKGPAFDIGHNLVVRINRRLPRPHFLGRVKYRVSVDDGDPAKIFPSGGSQQVHSLDDGTATIEVVAVRPGQDQSPAAAAANAKDKPTAGDLEPNSQIQSDDPVIKKLAAQVAADKDDTWKTAQAIERFVHQQVEEKNFSQAFASALEVAKSKQGDCTEHSVLLAAIARAHGIPARCAFGLVYSASLKGFAYHMWNEVWIDDRWVPLDGTLAYGGIGGAHIKLGHSNFKGVSPLASLMPVFQIMGQLKVEVIEVKDSM